MAQCAIKVYSDYKSPYAYLAKDLVYELERDTGARIELATLYPRYSCLSRQRPASMPSGKSERGRTGTRTSGAG